MSILISTREVWLLVQRDDGKCSSLILTRNHFLLHHHPAMSLVVETRLSRIKVDGLRTWSPPDSFTFPSAIGKIKKKITIFGRWHFLCIESPSVDFWCAPSFPTPQCLRPKCLLSRFFPLTRHNRRIFQGVLTGLWQTSGNHRTKWNYWSNEWFAESPFVRCFPIRQEILSSDIP